MFLPRPDVIRLTGKQRYAAQRRALDSLGIRYVTAATGEPLVTVEALDGRPSRARAPRWDRITA